MKNNFKQNYQSNYEQYYIRYLLRKLGPILYQAKPAELLSFPAYDKKSALKIDIIERCFRSCNKIAYRIIDYKKSSKKVFFYNKEKLNNLLKQKKQLFFLIKLGYPNKYDMKDYIDFLIEKIANGEIPPELGVFLGYPLKDVRGFMGFPGFKLTKINGWRVYGNPELSDKIYGEISAAREKIKLVLQESAPEEILLAI